LTMDHPLLAASSLDALLDLFRSDDERGVILRVFALLAFGAAGVYLMLPRGARSDIKAFRWLGAAMVTLSFVLLVSAPVSHTKTHGRMLWIEAAPSHTEEAVDKDAVIAEAIDIESGNVVFYVLAAITLVSAVMMITSRNP